jgi:hypothetical protein
LNDKLSKPPPTPEQAREARLAKALRDNLRRRKAPKAAAAESAGRSELQPPSDSD